MDLSTYIQSMGMDPFWIGLILGIILCAIARVGMAMPRKGVGATYAMTSTTERDRYTNVSISYEVQGVKRELDRELLLQVLQAIQNGNHLESIKILRNGTGLGLKESKELVDTIIRMAKRADESKALS